MGTKENSIIKVNEDLKVKKGQSVRFAFTGQLNGPTIYDDAPLIANAETLGTYYDDVTVRPRAKAVSSSDWGDQLSAIDLREAAREGLRDWTDRETRDETIKALGAVGANCDVPFATATVAEKNTWNVNNVDRVLYGATTANYNATFLTATNNIDATADRLTRRAVSLMKRICFSATPKIAPIRTGKNGKRYLVGFAPSLLFRDLAIDLEQSNREVRLEDKNTILFEGGDLYWDGVIVHEVDDLPIYTGIGAGGSVNVSPFYLCGQMAVGYGLAKRWTTKTEKTDLERFDTVGTEGWWGMKKMARRAAVPLNAAYVNKQVGVVTGFFASVAD
jgi:hypothetical protein